MSPTCSGFEDAEIMVVAEGAQGADYFFLDSIGSQPPLNFGNFGDLPSGQFMTYVQDAAGCLDSLEVIVPDTEPMEVVIELTSPVSCSGEEDAELSVVTANGGTGSFVYFLSSEGPDFTTSDSTWTGLAPGQTVSVYATDSNGCVHLCKQRAHFEPAPIVVSLYLGNCGCQLR